MVAYQKQKTKECVNVLALKVVAVARNKRSGRLPESF